MVPPVGQPSPIATDHEQLLVAVARHQDRCAFEQLFNDFSKPIYGMGMRIARNDQMAKDLVQDVMLAVWQNAVSYDLDKGSARTWIFSLSRNKCIDMLRRAQRQPQTIAAGEIWPTMWCDEGRAVDQSEHRMDIETIGRLSLDLPAPQRVAVEMVYLQDLSHEEAASQLEVPLGTFKSRLRLGLIKLRQLISEHHV